MVMVYSAYKSIRFFRNDIGNGVIVETRVLSSSKVYSSSLQQYHTEGLHSPSLIDLWKKHFEVRISTLRV